MGLQQPPASPGLQRAGLRVLELYSGLGGMRAALERALPMARLQFTAIDINTTANRVYAHNFRDHPLTLSLEHCSAADLARTGTTGPADVWTLSPPCQPFTQTSNSQRRDLADPRAASFAHLMALLPQLPGPLPRYILLEAHAAWRKTLDYLGYTAVEVVLCPSQLGMPYSRPRFFALAKAPGLHFSERALQGLAPLALSAADGTQGAPRSSTSHGAGAGSAAVLAAGAASRHGPLLGPLLPGCSQRTLAEFLDWQLLADAGSQGRSDPGSGGVRIADSSSGGSGRGDSVGTSNKHSVCSCSRDDGSSRGIIRSSSSSRGSFSSINCTATTTTAASMDCTTTTTSSRSSGIDCTNSTNSTNSTSCTSTSSSSSRGQDEERWWWSSRYTLPPSWLQRYSAALDPVTPASSRCNCFTKGYGRNAHGAGSVLLSDAAAAELCVRDAKGRLKLRGFGSRTWEPGVEGLSSAAGPALPAAACSASSGAGRGSGGAPVGISATDADRVVGWETLHGQLRFFTPQEVARLHGLPPGFSFPPDLSDRQCWALLGNSISVDAVAYLLSCLFDGEEGGYEAITGPTQMQCL